MDITFLKDEFELEVIEKDNIVKWITNYEGWSYEWHWYLIALSEDWLWRKYELWHCSCNWPLENWYSWKFTKNDILLLMESEPTWYDYSEEDKKLIIDFILNND